MESTCSGRLSHVSSQPAMLPTSHSILGRDKRLPLDTWNQSGLQENVFGKSMFYVWFIQKSSSTNSIWRRAKKPGSSPWSLKDEDYSRKWRQIKSRNTSNADICNKAVDNVSNNTGGITVELHCRSAETANIGIAIRQTPKSTNVCSMSIARLGSGTAESHGEPRRQHLHLQLRNGQLHNGKRVGARGNLHYLRNGGDSGLLEGISENRREVWTGPHSQYTSVQYSLFTSAERTSRGWLKGQHGSSHPDCISFLCAWKESVIWWCTGLTLCCSLHLTFTTSTSSSSITLPCSAT